MIAATHYYLGTTLLFLSLLTSLLRKPTVSILLNSLTFLTLFHAYLSDNFLLEVVYHSSHEGLPFYYKIIASWTTHEGSMLLWIWSLSLYSFIFSKIYRNSQIYQITTTMQLYIAAIFLLFIIYSSNPFKNFTFFPATGLGLNPILQDTALVIHPPILYLGYVGTSICFSIALAILLTGKSGKEEFKILLFFLLIAFALLTLGIALGGWWSYRELGWGGFWAWDPIENVSLFPWLLLLGAIHSSFLSMRQNKYKALSILLSILCFITSICGTYISRMGVTDSLHTFNTNAESGIYFLIVIVLLFAISAIIFIARGHILWSCKENQDNAADPASYFILMQTILCIILFILVFLGTLAPTLSQKLGYDSIYIAQSFYNAAFGKIAIVLSICLCSFIAFKSKSGDILARFVGCLIVAIILSLGNFKDTLTAFLSISGAMTMLIVLTRHIHNLKTIGSIKEIFTNRKNAFFLTHMGFGLFLYAIAGFTSNSLENKQYFKLGDQITVKNYTIKLVQHEKLSNELFSGVRATFSINRGTTLKPELRFYRHEKKLNTESATRHYLLNDVQIVISGLDDTLGLAVETHYKDKIQLIWLSLIMLIAGTAHKILLY